MANRFTVGHRGHKKLEAKVAITRKEVDHVARLARLSLTDDEKARYTAQLDSILQYIEKLGTLKTDQVAPTSHVLPLANVWRTDKAEPGGLCAPEDLLKNAPEREENFFKVKKVIE